MQVFGLLGLFIADLCLNFGSISYPAYRILSLIIYAVMWLISTFREDSSSVNHVSHIVGLLVGATWGSLYLPSLPNEIMELASPIIGASKLLPSATALCGQREFHIAFMWPLAAGLVMSCLPGSHYSTGTYVTCMMIRHAVLLACFGCLVIPIAQGILTIPSTCSGSETDSWSRVCTPPWQ